jgi:tetratricopeptide (TPR) repeat protein
MYRSILTILVCAAVCLCLASPGLAIFKPEVEKAKELMDQDMYEDAIKILKRHIQKEPTDGDAFIHLGICYLNTDNVIEADESFKEAAKISSDHHEELATIYQEMAAHHLELIDLEHAKAFYDQTVEYNPDLADETFLKNLGYLYLKKAADSTGNVHQLLKERAAELIGQELVDQVFPGPSIGDIFKAEYTDADITKPDKDGGWIDLFDWSAIREGKAIIIEGQIPPGGSEIYYFRGEEFDPPYLPTVNGKKTISIKNRPLEGKFAIWIQKDKGIIATVRIIDEAPTPPRPDLIPPLIRQKPEVKEVEEK